MSKGLFITGTGTDVGKMYITALIVKKLHDAKLRAGYYKAAVSGNEKGKEGLIPGDPQFVKTLSGIEQPLHSMVSYVYEVAVSPHLASKWEGCPIEMDVIKRDYQNVQTICDYVTVEGSGGILCPISMDEKEIWLEDIIKTFALPSLIVADAGLGTINSVILTVEYMKQKNLKVKGIILNNFHKGNRMEEDNRYMIENKTGIPVLECVEEGQEELKIDLSTLMNLYE